MEFNSSPNSGISQHKYEKVIPSANDERTEFGIDSFLKLLSTIEGCNEVEELEQKLLPLLLCKTKRIFSTKTVEFENLTRNDRINFAGTLLTTIKYLVNYKDHRSVRKYGISLLQECFQNKPPDFLTNFIENGTISVPCDEEKCSEQNSDKMQINKTCWSEFFVLIIGLEESQFHLIEPLLPKVETLLAHCKECKFNHISIHEKLLPPSHRLKLPESEFCPNLFQFSWDWLSLIFEKALCHRNGWIRYWAMWVVVKSIPARLLVSDMDFIFDAFIMFLNDHDPFERLILRSELESFLEHFRVFIARIGEVISSWENKELYYRRLACLFAPIIIASSDQTWWKFVPLFYLTSALRSIGPFPAFFFGRSSETSVFYFAVLCKLIREVSSIQYVSLRYAIMENVASMIIRLTRWDDETIWLLPLLFAPTIEIGGSDKAPGITFFRQHILKHFVELIHAESSQQVVLKQRPERALFPISHNALLDEFLEEVWSKLDGLKRDSTGVHHLFATLAWTLAEHFECSDKMLSAMETLFIEYVKYGKSGSALQYSPFYSDDWSDSSDDDVPEPGVGNKIDLMLALWLQRPNPTVRSNNKSFEDCVCKTIGVDDDSDLISNVYIPSFFQINQWKDKYEQQTQIKQMLEPIFTSTRKAQSFSKANYLSNVFALNILRRLESISIFAVDGKSENDSGSNSTKQSFLDFLAEYLKWLLNKLLLNENALILLDIPEKFSALQIAKFMALGEVPNEMDEQIFGVMVETVNELFRLFHAECPAKFSYNLDALTNDQILKSIEQIANSFSAWSDFDERSVLAQLLWNLLNEYHRHFESNHQQNSVTTVTMALDGKILVCIFNTLDLMVREERKSRNFLHAVELQLQILFSPLFLHLFQKHQIEEGDEAKANGDESMSELTSLIKDLVADYIEQATLNVFVGVILSQALFNVRSHLKPVLWANQLIQLATFGQIPKKDILTLHKAYEMAYKSDNFFSPPLNQRIVSDTSPTQKFGKMMVGDENSANKEKLQFLASSAKLYERKHEAAYRIRLFSISIILYSLNNCDTEENFRLYISTTLDRLNEMGRCKSRSFGFSQGHRQMTRHVQLLLLLVGVATNGAKEDVKYEPIFRRVLFDYCMKALLDSGQQNSVKLFVEWTISRIISKNYTLFNEFKAIERELLSNRIGSVCSWLNIMTHYYSSHQFETADFTSTSSESVFEFMREAFNTILPWSTEQNFSVRCTALGGLQLLWKKFHAEIEQTSHPQLLNRFNNEFNFINRINQFDLPTPGNQQRIVANLCADFYFAKFNSQKHFQLQTIFEVFPTKTALPAEECIPLALIRSHFNGNENVANLNSSRQNTVEAECSDTEFLSAPSLIFIGRAAAAEAAANNEFVDETETEGQKEMEKATYSGAVNNSTDVHNKSCNCRTKEHQKDAATEVQRKTTMLINASSDMLAPGIVNPRTPTSDTDLIVVASLINRPANLGGIFRTSEIFGVRTICVNNIRWMEHQDFKSLSMCAEKWLQIEEVRRDDLHQYLEAKRASGYTIIAAEQTTQSVPLEKFKFPAKSVLLMGDEKEGVPVELFPHVNQTIEISQIGKTRSLNVHVSAALCIHRFASQHLLPMPLQSTSDRSDNAEAICNN